MFCHVVRGLLYLSKEPLSINFYVTVDIKFMGTGRRGPVLGGPLWDILVLDLRIEDLYQDVD